MIEKLTLEAILAIVRTTPEQTVFDWKQDLRVPRDDESKGEIVKDLMAVANGTAFTHHDGYVFYGVHASRPDPVVGVSETWDDAKLQQLVASVLDPAPEFLLYDVDAGAGRTVVVLHVPMSKKPSYVAPVYRKRTFPPLCCSPRPYMQACGQFALPMTSDRCSSTFRESWSTCRGGGSFAKLQYELSIGE
jgi:hypothetical protein